MCSHCFSMRHECACARVLFTNRRVISRQGPPLVSDSPSTTVLSALGRLILAGSRLGLDCLTSSIHLDLAPDRFVSLDGIVYTSACDKHGNVWQWINPEYISNWNSPILCVHPKTLTGECGWNDMATGHWIYLTI